MCLSFRQHVVDGLSKERRGGCGISGDRNGRHYRDAERSRFENGCYSLRRYAAYRHNGNIDLRTHRPQQT